MGKISPVSAKYIIHSYIQIEGVVERPDVIGAIFGQTEGLLGSDLELRELQRSGRIGRIDVNTEIKSGKTEGIITIPSSLDKAETVIIGAALETIKRIGPCNSKVSTNKIEDVRISKRNYVIERAKELLKNLTDDVLPNSQEITNEVSQSVRAMEIREYGRDRLAAGPTVDESDEVIVVEGRADVLNLLKNGIKNVIALNGTSVPETIVELSKKKIIILFVDGDRGGDLIIKEVSSVADIDYVVKAPDGKEVEEITKKEIHKALRAKIAIEQAKLEVNPIERKDLMNRKQYSRVVSNIPRPRNINRNNTSRAGRSASIMVNSNQKKQFKTMLDDLVGTRGAYVLDGNSNILGKVPTSELTGTLNSLGSGVHTVIFDGDITSDLVDVAERRNVKCLVAMSSRVRPSNTGVYLLTNSDF